MDGSQVVALFTSFDSAGVRAWAAGGWAVDAVVGLQTRHHGDLDLAVDDRDLTLLLGVLDEQGFTVAVDQAPSRLELTAPDGRIVDVHPVTFADDGGGVQAGLDGDTFDYAPTGFSTGTIEGRLVPCLSVEQQLRFRAGYKLRPEDHHDLALLTRLGSDER